jgi:hypothetical protein
LNEALPERHVTVANAGVPAWSSFQSLKYLELRGLELEPDLVLFYHELNDYLPSSLRDSSNNEIGALQTDRELYDSRLQRTRRAFFERSALFRFLSYQIARLRIAGFGTADFDNPLLDIGLPDIGLAPRLKQRDGEAVARNEWVLGRRVSEPGPTGGLVAGPDPPRLPALGAAYVPADGVRGAFGHSVVRGFRQPSHRRGARGILLPGLHAPEP